MVDRRKFLQASVSAALASNLPLGWVIREAGAAEACEASILGCGTFGLSDPEYQFAHAAFTTLVPDALATTFKYIPDKKGRYKVDIGTAMQQTGLVDANDAYVKLNTPVWGYGDSKDRSYTWPGRTFEVQSGPGTTEVFWKNKLNGVGAHPLPVDTTAHWCYSLPGYESNTIANSGVPCITHLHGGHTDFQFDGNPEFFYGPKIGGAQVIGPQWANAPGGFTTKFRYDNNVRAGNLWYHDHALGITRLNVYAGLAGFYFIRDDFDTGKEGNPAGLPASPYEKAYAIQDRMFLNTGELFYPAFPGDPYYEGFIDEEGAVLPAEIFPGGGPTALAEFFGDHMVVNGVIWPKEDVEPRNYRLHLLNGTDSRFMALQFWAVAAGATDFVGATGPLPFQVIGSDQGLASSPMPTDLLLSEPGSRYDVVFDFGRPEYAGKRIIMKNIGGDEPFGGAIGEGQLFEFTDRVMAFDVVLPISSVADVAPTGINFPSHKITAETDKTRKVALFEGKDEYGRLQPLLGTAEPATDYLGNPIFWQHGPLAGLQMEGSIAWHSATTENPALGSTEEWVIWNVTGDAHPVHLHLVHFEVMEREEIVWDGNTIEEGDILLDGTIATEDDETQVIPNAKATSPAGDGTYVVNQPVLQHNGELGDGFKIMGHTTNTDAVVPTPVGYVENAPKDMVTALPGQVTRIKATFDKPGRYVWHCHILSHEDHEMMRVLHVGPGA